MAIEPSWKVRDRAEQVARRAAGLLRIDNSEDVRTLSDAYAVAYEFQAPLMVRIADDMLADLRADVGSRRTDRIVALGRDGHSLAIAMSGLDPGLYQRNVSHIVLSRALVENALQDLERRQNMDFSQVDGYRRVASRVDPADTIGGFRALDDFLQARQVPVGRAGSRVTLFDTSFRSTFCLPMSRRPSRISSSSTASSSSAVPDRDPRLDQRWRDRAEIQGVPRLLRPAG